MRETPILFHEKMSLSLFRRSGTLYLRDLLALINHQETLDDIVVVECFRCRLKIPSTQILHHIIEGHGRWKKGKQYITIASSLECICGKYWLASSIYAFIDHLWQCANLCMSDNLKSKLLKNRKSKAGIAIQYIGRRWSRMYDVFGIPVGCDPFTFHAKRMETLCHDIDRLHKCDAPTVSEIRLIKIMHDIEDVRDDFGRFKIFQMNNMHYDAWLRAQMVLCPDWSTITMHLRLVSEKAKFYATRFAMWLEVERENLTLELRKRRLLEIDDKESLIWLELHHQCNVMEIKKLVDIDEKHFLEAIKNRGISFTEEERKTLLRKQDAACRLSAKSHAVMMSISYLEAQVNIGRRVY